MIVAAGAADREPEPDCAERGRAVEHRGNPELLLVDAPFLVGQGLPVERRRDPGPAGCVRKQVAGKLLDRETIEWEVAVDGIDYPVAINVGVGTRAVGLVAVRIGVPGQVEPVAPPAFAEVRRGEQPVDQALVGIGPAYR